MTRTEHLLVILGEECAEVAQRASKALRFGLDEVQPEKALTNSERLADELCDLLAVRHMLERELRRQLNELKRASAKPSPPLCSCGHTLGAHLNDLSMVSYCRRCNCYGWSP